jgi:hypothetical protein
MLPETENQIEVVVIDQVRGTRATCGVPTDVPVKRLLPALVKHLGLPVEGPGGRPQEYYLAVGDPERQEALGEALEDEETLAEAGIQEGAQLHIMPVMFGGGPMSVDDMLEEINRQALDMAARLERMHATSQSIVEDLRETRRTLRASDSLTDSL